MFLAIILTLIFAVLGMTVLYLLKDNDDRANENLRLRRENAELHGRLSDSEIREWRRRESIRRTKELRPDLLENAELTAKDRLFLEEIEPKDH